jgi:hypothetical protein
MCYLIRVFKIVLMGSIRTLLCLSWCKPKLLLTKSRLIQMTLPFYRHWKVHGKFPRQMWRRRAGDRHRRTGSLSPRRNQWWMTPETPFIASVSEWDKLPISIWLVWYNKYSVLFWSPNNWFAPPRCDNLCRWCDRPGSRVSMGSPGTGPWHPCSV